MLENPILKGFPIFDLDRIEVLRGPQGTLFGRNTPAGIVKFESRKPTFEADGFARLSYGVYNTAKLEAAYGGPVAQDILAVRASFLYQGRSDYVTNTFTNEENVLGGYQDFAGRLQFLLTPGDKFSALLNLHMRDLEGTARLFQANIVESGSNEIRDGFKRDEIAVDGANEQTVKNSGGALTMESEPGHYTRFHMDLPVRTQAERETGGSEGGAAAVPLSVLDAPHAWVPSCKVEVVLGPSEGRVVNHGPVQCLLQGDNRSLLAHDRSRPQGRPQHQGGQEGANQRPLLPSRSRHRTPPRDPPGMASTSWTWASWEM